MNKLLFVQPGEEIEKEPEYQDKIEGKGWRSLMKFIGPAYLISVGYIDVGNWATDLSGGSKYGYTLLYVVLLSSLIGLLFQILCLQLGTVTNYDLAQQCRRVFHQDGWKTGRIINFLLYVMTELAIIATDLAEVVGTAIALNLLIGLPLVWGVVITALDVLVILKWWGAKYQKMYELLIFIIVLIVAVCFGILLSYTKPSFSGIMSGFVPRIQQLYEDSGQLLIVVGILGATVMPHNLYLHSAICKIRQIELPVEDPPSSKYVEIEVESESSSLISAIPLRSRASKKATIKYALIDTVVALAFAFVINATILVVGSSAFNSRGRTDINEIQDAYYALKEYVGEGAAVVFGIALLASGQSSTITGTLAGIYVMEGFLNLKLRLVFRRLVTRLLAILPALIIILISGDDGANNLLILSQVVLSMQLPFAVIPLVLFTSSRSIMGGKPTLRKVDDSELDGGQEFANGWIVTSLGVICCALVIFLNVMLIIQSFTT